MIRQYRGLLFSVKDADDGSGFYAEIFDRDGVDHGATEIFSTEDAAYKAARMAIDVRQGLARTSARSRR